MKGKNIAKDTIWICRKEIHEDEPERLSCGKGDWALECRIEFLKLTGCRIEADYPARRGGEKGY